MTESVEPLDPSLFPELSDRQRQAVPIVLAGPTVAAGLSAAEVPRSTWYRWRQEAAFTGVLFRLQREAMRESIGNLQTGTRFAVTCLLGLLTSKSEQVRLQASREVLSFAMRGAELLEVSERLDVLEAALGPLLEDAGL